MQKYTKINADMCHYLYCTTSCYTCNLFCFMNIITIFDKSKIDFLYDIKQNNT